MKPTHPGGKATRILVVDDHPLVRQGLSDLLRREPDFEVTGEAASHGEALQAMEKTGADLVIVDVSLKDSYGLELIKDIRARFPAARVLVVTVHDEMLYADRALRAGAAGYLTKDEATFKVVEAVRQVLRGEFVVSPKIAAQMASRLAQHTSGGEVSGRERLSGRELEILELIGEGLSRQRIAERLRLDVNTVETYRARIREKLQLKDANELLQYAIRAHRSQDSGI